MIPPTIGPPDIRVSKPRASGDDPTKGAPPKLMVGVNPARAGMIRADARTRVYGAGKPRASGDDPGVICRRGLTYV